jgi:hypothetical protein
MAKHDDDNRANQLNPNNDAYWSSRGYGGSGSESGEGGPGPTQSSDLSLVVQAFRVDPATQWHTNPDGVRERFFLDVLLADGSTTHAQLTVRFPFKGFSGWRLQKHEDLLPQIGPTILGKLEAAAGCAVIQPVWKDANGSVLDTSYDFHFWTPNRPFSTDTAAHAFLNACAGRRDPRAVDLGVFGPNSIYRRNEQTIHFGPEEPVADRTFDFRLENVSHSPE